MNKKTLSGLPAWLLRLLRDGHSHSYTNQALSALRFLHLRVLRAPAPVAGIPRAKRKKTLPVVLSESEVRKFLGALGNPKHRAIVFILYSGGLRVSEAARLKIADIDSDRGQIHVRQGKGRKDRYVMVSPVVLGVLREYVRVERPYGWLFPAGHRRDRHITTRAIQREVKLAAKRAGIEKRVTPHVLRHSFATDGGREARGSEVLVHEPTNNSWDLARAFARRTPTPDLKILVAVGSNDMNYQGNLDWMDHLRDLGILFEEQIPPGVRHNVTALFGALGPSVELFHDQCFGGAPAGGT